MVPITSDSAIAGACSAAQVDDVCRFPSSNITDLAFWILTDCGARHYHLRIALSLCAIRTD
jgi:hypothetical protein